MASLGKTEQRFALRSGIHGRFIIGGKYGRKTKYPQCARENAGHPGTAQ